MRASRLSRPLVLLSAAVLLAGLLAWPAAVTAQSELEQRLRQALRQANAQVTTLQNERTALQSQVQQLEASIEDVARAAENRVAQVEVRYEAALKEFNDRMKQEGEYRNTLLENNEKWQIAYTEVADVARQKEVERQVLTTDLAETTSQLEACEAANGELFRVGNEVLDRLRSVSFGDVLGYREPFIGAYRVELQDVVQTYEDKVLDNQLHRP